VEMVTQESLAQVIGCRVDIRPVLDNRMTNAILHACGALNPQILLRIVPEESSVITRHSNNGVGIPYEYRERIFDPFFQILETGEKRGNALGVRIVKELIESHNGRVWVESEPGKGATFGFSLPASVPSQHIEGLVAASPAPLGVTHEHPGWARKQSVMLQGTDLSNGVDDELRWQAEDENWA
jgi:signal transduction histidine kinase